MCFDGLPESMWSYVTPILTLIAGVCVCLLQRYETQSFFAEHADQRIDAGCMAAAGFAVPSAPPNQCLNSQAPRFLSDLRQHEASLVVFWRDKPSLSTEP